MPERQILFRTFGRIFTGLSDTSKAFLIILITGGWLHACLRAMVWLVRIPSGGGKATRGRPPHYAHRWVLANVCACGRVWWWWQACWARHGAACSFTMALPAPVQWCLPLYSGAACPIICVTVVCSVFPVQWLRLPLPATCHRHPAGVPLGGGVDRHAAHPVGALRHGGRGEWGRG